MPNSACKFLGNENSKNLVVVGDSFSGVFTYSSSGEKDIKMAHNSITRTQDIFTELKVTLDPNAGDWAKQMFNVYSFINDRLLQANIKKDEAIMDEVIPLIEEVRNIWNEAYKLSVGQR